MRANLTHNYTNNVQLQSAEDKITQRSYLRQYHNSNPWNDSLSHSQRGEPGHVS